MGGRLGRLWFQAVRGTMLPAGEAAQGAAARWGCAPVHPPECGIHVPVHHALHLVKLGVDGSHAAVERVKGRRHEVQRSRRRRGGSGVGACGASAARCRTPQLGRPFGLQTGWGVVGAQMGGLACHRARGPALAILSIHGKQRPASTAHDASRSAARTACCVFSRKQAHAAHLQPLSR